jgi:hypothetical protein
MFNDRPRKILNWHSPAHGFHCLLRRTLNAQPHRSSRLGL